MKKKVVYILISLFIIAGVILVSSINLDLNHDGAINITDLQLLAVHFEGKAAYNSTFDLNNDSKIDLFDLVAVARNVNLSSGGQTVNSSGILFNSDWSTATGSSMTALQDGGKWNSYCGGAALNLTVVPATGIFNSGFANTLRAFVDGTCNTVQLYNGWPNPTVNESLYFRTYLYIDIPNVEIDHSAAGNHPFEQRDPNDNIAWAIEWNNTQGSDYVGLSMNHGTSTINSPYGKPAWFGPVIIKKRTPYRIEFELTKKAGTNFTINAMRIYNATSGVLIYNTSDFPAYGGGYTGPTEPISYFTWTAPTNASLVGLTSGTNGPIDNGLWGSTINESQYPIYFYWAADCVRNDTWCGPYSNGV